MQWKTFVFAFLAALAGASAYHFINNKDNVDFETLDGSAYQWQQLQGQWVVVNYFAEWCAPCLKEVPELNEFNEYSKTNDNVSLFAVSFDQVSDSELRRIKTQYEMEFPLIKTGAVNMPMQRPDSLPATYLIRPDGTVARHLLGEQSAQKLIQALALLEGS
ncbi:TlpA family protein disulfide reductase [Aestuariibacter salexigens]|uniref:TlpA family protein disulfide reductase n=1 Tax=Aestuariibacter salexigens TaxID=226010 RepID=UPI0005519CEA|nr:TlpA disulfide reductase family protein [Aestuariibacter salexigens]